MKTNRTLIFKTDISSLCSNCEVHKMLNRHEAISNWSIDTEDADNVLCITSETLTPDMVISLIGGLGHKCAELQ